uniref:AAA family ATPase n=1 Tax=Candidatus Phytoplasma sp. AldY-WA1 TaxID=2852100 RepID=UPI00254A4FB0
MKIFKKHNKKTIVVIVVILLIIFSFLFQLLKIGQFNPEGQPITESQMLSKLSRSDISESVKYSTYYTMFMKDKPFSIRKVYKIELKTKNNEIFKSEIIRNNSNSDKEMSFELLSRDKVCYQFEINFFSWFLSLFDTSIRYVQLLSSLIFTIYIFMAIRRESGNLQKNPLVSSKQKSIFTFKDVAGNEEEKEEMKELIDFLKNPRKYVTIGASIPKGVLLEGPPGTGKTLLAKALAGEAGTPFYAVTGSEFMDRYFGVGASRVKKLFQEIRNNAPCVLFIDEIDTVGKQRGSIANDDGSTINQLLTEMDGFKKSEGIIIVAATNRADILDPALIRPGRFDRHFIVGLPDIKAREAILKVHARNKNISSDINFHQLAKQTPGMSGAQLGAILNEASILTVRNQKEMITMEELEEAIDRVLMG